MAATDPLWPPTPSHLVIRRHLGCCGRTVEVKYIPDQIMQAQRELEVRVKFHDCAHEPRTAKA